MHVQQAHYKLTSFKGQAARRSTASRVEIIQTYGPYKVVDLYRNLAMMYLQAFVFFGLVSMSLCLDCENPLIYVTDGSEGNGVLYCVIDHHEPKTCEVEDPSNPTDTSELRRVNVTTHVLDDMKSQCQAANIEKRSTRQKRTSWSYLETMHPGTKWCGEGNEASAFDDLGDRQETDKCCRDHDSGCGDGNEIILPLTCPSNSVCKMVQITRHHCDCEDNFKACLKRVIDSPSASTDDKLAADVVGKTYFNDLGQTCYITETYVKVSHDIYFNEHTANATRHVWQDVSSFTSS